MGLVRSIADRFCQFVSSSFRSIDVAAQDDQWLGHHGERLAARFLKRNGYKVLYRNFRAPHGGEVDIVCRDRAENVLAFVEVKTRRSTGYGRPSEAVNLGKQKLIARGGMAWLALLGRDNIASRFDIVEIVISENGPEFTLLKNAFPLPEPYIG